MMHQTAPWPYELADLVDSLSFRADRGWEVRLADDFERDPGCRGLTLIVLRVGPDSYHPDQIIPVSHYFPVPAATYNRQSWQWWLLGCLRYVDDHERAEDFIIDGRRPYAPNHGPGWDPYLVTVLTTDEARRTSFRGTLNPGTP